jgi:hypothetical protein
MDPRVRATSRLHMNLTLEDVAKTVPVGTRHEDNPVFLIQTMIIDILEDICLPKFVDQFAISIR